LETLHEFLAAKLTVDSTKSSVGSAIREMRVTANLSQNSLAHLAGVNQAYLSQVESGKTPSTDSLQRIVSVLDTYSIAATATSSVPKTQTSARQQLTRRKEPVMARLYEYAVLLEEKRDKDGEVVEESEVVVEITSVLARDDAQAQMLAARAIPEQYVKNGKLDRLVVVVRPF
jgi:transcriptional regulator with XRE-family HTH domain